MIDRDERRVVKRVAREKTRQTLAAVSARTDKGRKIEPRAGEGGRKAGRGEKSPSSSSSRRRATAAEQNVAGVMYKDI